MPYGVVIQAIDQARTRDPMVKAMALLHASRVMAAMDRKLASQIYHLRAFAGTTLVQSFASLAHTGTG
jgi:hypothetical protein